MLSTSSLADGLEFAKRAIALRDAAAKQRGTTPAGVASLSEVPAADSGENTPILVPFPTLHHAFETQETCYALPPPSTFPSPAPKVSYLFDKGSMRLEGRSYSADTASPMLQHLSEHEHLQGVVVEDIESTEYELTPAEGSHMSSFNNVSSTTRNPRDGAESPNVLTLTSQTDLLAGSGFASILELTSALAASGLTASPGSRASSTDRQVAVFATPLPSRPRTDQIRHALPWERPGRQMELLSMLAASTLMPTSAAPHYAIGKSEVELDGEVICMPAHFGIIEPGLMRYVVRTKRRTLHCEGNKDSST